MKHREKLQYNCKFSATPPLLSNLLCCDLLIVSNNFKTDLLRNTWRIRSSIVDLNIENSPLREGKWKN